MRRGKFKPFWKLEHARPFTELRTWFSEKVTLDAYQDPLNSIMYVDDHVLSVGTPYNNFRLAFFIPWVVSFWVLFFYVVNDIGPNQGMINSANYMIELNNKNKLNGIEYDTKRDLYYKAMVGDDGKGSTLDLIRAVALYGTENYRSSIYSKITIASVLFLVAIISTLALLRFPRMANIYFDRRRRIVYTWRLGKVAACDFDNLGFRETAHGLNLLLMSENKKRQYWPANFTVQPTGRPHLNTENDNTEFIAQVFAFMDKGKKAVITGERFERAYPKSYLFVDKKPDNFEHRVEEILKRDSELPELYAKHLF
ncbi:hypothetical protein [Vibrio hepatarius]|uniref:hypothetical protein n=1 Tax=Vibrio hepatarius TaxID=171383 RepID=UPI001C08459F|nr:hypothetical protein [Vibrio hepatarius]MBU2895581.1 hypothetical protein [Vibrio hepatarius]